MASGMVVATTRAVRAVLACAFAVSANAAQATDEQARDIMNEIVAALQVVLPLSLDGARFDDPTNRERIHAALRQLAANSERLGAHDPHGGTGDTGYAFLSRSLASDARDVERRYAQGRISEARFLLHHVTEVCVACHSTLPDNEVRTIGRRLMADEAIAALPVAERIQFEMATRQFDAATASFELLFAAPDSSPADLDRTGFYETYLELCLRVRENPDRAIATLQKLERRKDVPERMRGNLASWIASLRELRESSDVEPSLPRARALIAQAEDRERFSDDREALIPFIAASGLLHRIVASQTDDRSERGEAYYLLGVVESNIGRSFWASQTEEFLTAAIRIGPGEPYAEAAYALLEEFVVASFTGSAGENVPSEIRRSLQQLRASIDAARTGTP